jgi:ATP-dependent DNA ligase
MRSTSKKKATKKTATKKTAKVSPEPRRAPRRPKEAEPRASPAAPAAVPVAGAVPAGSLDTSFGALTLPLLPPVSPMEASVAEALPPGGGWQFEPKWDGFRCLVFKSANRVGLQSKSGQSLGRYFPEVMAAIAELPVPEVVLDGEIVIIRDGRLAFDDLLLRIHPAESRVRALSRESPAVFVAFDLLVGPKGELLASSPLAKRRKALAALFRRLPKASSAKVFLSPATEDRAEGERFLRELAAAGFDGVMAKRLDAPYAFGERTAMVKVKRARTADCVVGGFRYAANGREVGSLLLGLYNAEGLLDHVGFTSSFAARDRAKLLPVLKPLMGPPGFTGKAPGGPSRWSQGRSTEWEPLRPELVCEVRYDHFTGGRFRHGAKFLRWRPDKTPEKCTFGQVHSAGPAWLLEALGVG